MRRIFNNLWLQLFVGLVVGVLGVIVAFPLAILSYIKFAGFELLFGVGSSGDRSPITFVIAVIFFVLTFTFPISVWFFLNRYGTLESASNKARKGTFILFLTAPLWVYMGWQVTSKIQTINEDYHAVRERCIINDGINREVAQDLTYEFECRNGIMNGFTKAYNAQGVLVFEGNNINGELNGTTTSYNDSGSIIRVSNYNKGEIEGVEVFYNHDGSTNIYTIHERGQTKLIYYQIPEDFYNPYNDLDLESQRIICNDQETSLVQQYSFSCQNGLISGEFIRYGHVSFRVTMINGIPDGIYEKFVDGKLDSHLEFKNGKLDGKVQRFFSDGKLEYEGHYQDALQEGIFRRYDYEGHLKSEVVFKDGQLIRINRFSPVSGP